MTEFPIETLLDPERRARCLAAIPGRRSIRVYQGDPEEAQLLALRELAPRICLPGVRIAFGEGASEHLYRRFPFVEAIRGTNQYAAFIADTRCDAAEICAGVSGEAFVLEAAALGVGTCWVMAFKHAGVSDIPLYPGEKVLAITPLGIPGEAPGPRPRKKLSEIVMNPLDQLPQWAIDAAECVRLAPSAVNFQPWRIAFDERSVDLISARKNPGLDLGIALLHLTLGMKDIPHTVRRGQGDVVASLTMEDKA